jgi:hypothetical protein
MALKKIASSILCIKYSNDKPVSYIFLFHPHSLTFLILQEGLYMGEFSELTKCGVNAEVYLPNFMKNKKRHIAILMVENSSSPLLPEEEIYRSSI